MSPAGTGTAVKARCSASRIALMIAARTELPVARATASWKRTSRAATSGHGTPASSARAATSPTMCSSSARTAGSARRAAQAAFSASNGTRNSASSRAVAERKRSRAPSARRDELGARLGDEGAAARAGADLDHALGLQRAQRLAQRGARDAEGRTRGRVRSATARPARSRPRRSRRGSARRCGRTSARAGRARTTTVVGMVSVNA